MDPHHDPHYQSVPVSLRSRRHRLRSWLLPILSALVLLFSSIAPIPGMTVPLGNPVIPPTTPTPPTPPTGPAPAPTADPAAVPTVESGKFAALVLAIAAAPTSDGRDVRPGRVSTWVALGTWVVDEDDFRCVGVAEGECVPWRIRVLRETCSQRFDHAGHRVSRARGECEC
jgi:hypothetical protein